MFAALGAVARQARGAAQAKERLPRCVGRQLLRTAKAGHGHGASGGGGAELVRRAADPVDQRRAGIRHNRLEHRARSARLGQQIGNRQAAAAGQRQHAQTGTGMNLLDQRPSLFSGVHGACLCVSGNGRRRFA